MRRITNMDIEKAAAKIESIIREIETRDAEIITRSREAAEKMLAGADPNRMGAEIHALKEARAIAAQALDLGKSELAVMKAEKPLYDKALKAAAEDLAKLEKIHAGKLSVCFKAAWEGWQAGLDIFEYVGQAETIKEEFPKDLVRQLEAGGISFLIDNENILSGAEKFFPDLLQSAGIPNRIERQQKAEARGYTFERSIFK